MENRIIKKIGEPQDIAVTSDLQSKMDKIADMFENVVSLHYERMVQQSETVE